MRSFFSLLTFLLSLVIYAGDSGDNLKQEEVEVVMGIDKILTVDFAMHTLLSVGNNALLNYQVVPQKREIVLKGQRAGQTSVTVRDTLGNIRRKYRVNITTNGQSQVVSELKEFIGDVEGLEIGIKGGKVYVGGEIVVPDDIGKVFVILERYPDVIRLYEISNQTKRVVAQNMQEEIQRNNLPNITVRVVNGTFWLEGVVPSEDQRELALRFAEGFIPQYNLQPLAGQASRIESTSRKAIIQNFITVNPEKEPPPPQAKMIKIMAQFVELSKDYIRRFGMKWTPALTSGGGTISFGKTTTDGVTSKSDGTFSGTISNLIPRLASIKSAGYARIVESGMILTEDKVKANISKSSSTPFTVGTNEFQRSLSLDTGFNLEVQPQIMGEEAIQLSIGFSVKIQKGSNGSTDNKVQTRIVVKSKESAVVGGITFNESQTDYDRDPTGGSDTVDAETGFAFFSFVRSKAYTLNKSQFVVFITPEIVESASASTKEIRRKFRQRKR